jgi:AraC-like DNA-binding protein
MFPQLFKINASDLSNQFLALNSVIPALARFIGQHFNSKQSLEDIQTIFDRYFYKHLSGITLDFDPRLYQAIDIILNRMGLVDIEKDLDTGLSSRQLRRLFDFYIGDTAKTFCKVVRFQNILKAKPSTQSLKQSKLFYRAGYYDQAHFIKEFKHFYGVTPSQAFGR